MKKIGLALAFAAAIALSFAACSNSSDSGAAAAAAAAGSGTGTGTGTGGGGGDNAPSYSITIGESTNGSVSADKTTAKAGETVTLTLAPDDGCEFNYLTVAAGELPCTATGNGNYRSFAMPACDVTVKAVFAHVSVFPSTNYEKIDSETMGGVEYDRVKFGDWPQTIKAENVTIDESDISRMGNFTYCKGSDGFWYLKVSENSPRDFYKYSDGTYVKRWYDKSYRWFKVEPIEWRVVSANSVVNGVSAKTLLSEKILTAKGFDKNSNNYKNSELRSYINGDFLNAAFSPSQKKYIADTELNNSAQSTMPYNYGSLSPQEQADIWNNGVNQYACENTTDKIFLFSCNDASYTMDLTKNGGQEGWLKRRPTDYSLACGLWRGDDGNERETTWWWLRSPYYKDRNASNGYIGGGKGSYYIETDGKYINVRIITNGNGGVVPVLRYDETGSASAGSSANASAETSVETAHLKAEAVDGGIKFTVKVLGEAYKDDFWLMVNRDGYGEVGRVRCEWNDKSANWTGVYPFVNAGSSYTAELVLHDAQDVESKEQVTIKATDGSGEMNYAGESSSLLEVSNEKIISGVVNYPPYVMPAGATDKKFFVWFFAGIGWDDATSTWDGVCLETFTSLNLVGPDSAKKCVYEIPNTDPLYATVKNAMTNQYPNKKIFIQSGYRFHVAGLSAECTSMVVTSSPIEPTAWRQ